MTDLPTRAQAEVLGELASGNRVNVNTPAGCTCIARRWIDAVCRK